MRNDCIECQGNGKCVQCDGTGINPHLNSDEPKCANCAGSGICPGCAGSGLWSPSSPPLGGGIITLDLDKD